MLSAPPASSSSSAAASGILLLLAAFGVEFQDHRLAEDQGGCIADVGPASRLLGGASLPSVRRLHPIPGTALLARPSYEGRSPQESQQRNRAVCDQLVPLLTKPFYGRSVMLIDGVIVAIDSYDALSSRINDSAVYSDDDFLRSTRVEVVDPTAPQTRPLCIQCPAQPSGEDALIPFRANILPTHTPFLNLPVSSHGDVSKQARPFLTDSGSPQSASLSRSPHRQWLCFIWLQGVVKGTRVDVFAGRDHFSHIHLLGRDVLAKGPFIIDWVARTISVGPRPPHDGAASSSSALMNR
jgi:hypothetical protein